MQLLVWKGNNVKTFSRRTVSLMLSLGFNTTLSGRGPIPRHSPLFPANSTPSPLLAPATGAKISTTAWSRASCSTPLSFVCEIKHTARVNLPAVIASTTQLTWQRAQEQCASAYSGNLATSLSSQDTLKLASSAWRVIAVSIDPYWFLGKTGLTLIFR